MLYVILLWGLVIVMWYLAAYFKISKSPNVLLSWFIIILNFGGKSHVVLYVYLTHPTHIYTFFSSLYSF